jgi:two-component system, LuxR family, response regulator FixJ
VISEDETPPAPKKADEPSNGLGPVVVVDDDDWVCDSLSVLLRAYGFCVHTYGSGAQFLADEGRAKAKCLVIDQHMPGLDGLEVVAELRRQGIPLPTILITGRVDPGTTQRATALGVLATLEKPFAAAGLVDVVRRAFAPPG